jgi:uracil-DNA glycosylase
MALLRPRLVIPVGTMAIEQVLGHTGPLAEVVGRMLRARYHEQEVEVIPLPHPSGASTWHRMEPGKSLLGTALKRLARHPEVRRAFGRRVSRARRRASG